MRLVLVCCLAVLLAGCASSPSSDGAASPLQLAAAGPEAALPSPEITADRLIAADGAVLPLRQWLPPGTTRAVVLALHGFNDYSNAFAAPAALWAEHGIATYAYDQRGFGRAPGRGLWPGERRLAGDAATALMLLQRRHPGTPVYLLGESMGGAVAILAALGRGDGPAPEVAGVILVAPAVWGRQDMNFIERAGLWLANLMPAVRWSESVLPVRITPSDNIPMLRAYSADPLVIRDTRADAVNGLVDLMSAAQSAAPWLDVPLLLLYGERDEIVPRAAMARFVEGLPGRARQRQRVALYPDGYHMLLRDLDQAVPIADVAAWIAAPRVSGAATAALPSGLDGNARARFAGQKGQIEAAMH